MDANVPTGVLLLVNARETTEAFNHICYFAAVG